MLNLLHTMLTERGAGPLRRPAFVVSSITSHNESADPCPQYPLASVICLYSTVLIAGKNRNKHSSNTHTNRATVITTLQLERCSAPSVSDSTGR